MLRLYVIYERPRDYPDHFVCRLWINSLAIDPPCAICSTLEEVRRKLRHQVPAGLINLGRFPEDDPTIVEVWV
jgi:hypothetical protein